MNKDSITVERAQELTWALLDEQITDDEFQLLDTLLLSDDAARQRYVECTRLHADLVSFFTSDKEKQQPAVQLPGLSLPVGMDCSVSDQAVS